MSKIENEKVAKAFEIISKDEDYKSIVGNALSLLAHVVDVGERIGRLKRVEANVGIDSISEGYHIVCEEIEAKK